MRNRLLHNCRGYPPEGTGDPLVSGDKSASADITQLTRGTWYPKPTVARSQRYPASLPLECKGPAGFDCEHGDFLYVYQDAPGQPYKAIYFDNEGHVIHYDVSTPTPTTAIFLSDASKPGPQFRLIY